MRSTRIPPGSFPAFPAAGSLTLRMPSPLGVDLVVHLDIEPSPGMALLGALGGRPVYGRAEHALARPESGGLPPPRGLRVFSPAS